MHDQIEQKRNKLKEMIAQLSENDRQAVIWAINNYHDIVRMCEAQPLTQAQREMHLEQATKEHDSFRLVLVLLERMINERK